MSRSLAVSCRSGRGRFLLAFIVASALVTGSVAASDPTASRALDEARNAVKTMHSSGALAIRTDAEVLRDLEEKGLFAGEKGASVREDVERFIRQIRYIKPTEPDAFRHGGVTTTTPETEPNNTIATANATSCGASICTSIQAAGDFDYFTYTLATASLVTHQTICDGDTILTLYDSGGAQIGFNDDSGGLCSYLAMSLAAGTYTIRVSEFLDDGTVNYTLNITCTVPPPPETEPNDSIGTANTLACGSAISGATDPIGDVDFFRVDVPVWSTVTVRTFNCVTDTTMFLRDSAGNELAFNDDFNGLCSEITQELFAGTYYVEIHDYLDDSIVTYYLDATCTPVPIDEVEPNGTIATANPIACGESKTGAHSPANDVDVWGFTLGAASTIVATVDCNGDSFLRLLDSGGAQIAADDNSGANLCSQVSASLAAGTYYLAVTESGQDATFVYTLGLDCAETVACGETKNAAISVIGEVDEYALVLGSDSFVTLDVTCDADGDLTVTDSLGNEIGYSDDVVGLCPRIRLNLLTGTYFVAVGVTFDDTTMNYSLGVTCEPPLDFESEPNDDPTMATPLACGGIVSGEVNPVIDPDFFSFTIAARSQIVAETECSGDTTLTLFDSSITEVAFDDDGGVDFCSRLVTTIDPGTYYILVGEFGADGTVGYLLDLECLAVPTVDEVEPNGDFGTANAIVCGEGLRGVIDPDLFDSDWWTFTLASTQRLFISVDTSQSDLDSALALYTFDAGGNLQKLKIADNTFDDQPAIQITLGPGPYYAEVTGISNPGAFSLYTLSVLCSAPTLTDLGCIDNGHTVNGNIGAPGTTAFATYAGRTGDRVRVIAKSPVFDPNVLVVRPDGQFVDFDDDDADLNGAQACATLPVDGPYRIYVGDFANGTGAFSLSLDLDSALTGAEVEPNNTRAQANQLVHLSHVSGTRSDASDHDFYKFSGNTNDVVRLEVRTCVGTDNTPNPPRNLTIEVYNNSNVLIASSLDDGEDADPFMNLVLPGSTGNYFVRVTGPTGGDYELFMGFIQIVHTFVPNVPCVVTSGTPISATIVASNPSPVRKNAVTFTVDRIPQGGAATRIRTRTANVPAGHAQTVILPLGVAPAVVVPTRFRYLGNLTFGGTSFPLDFEILVNP